MTKQLYRLVRTVTVIGTQEQLDAYENIIPAGTDKPYGGVTEDISNVGIRQIINDTKVPEPKQVL